MKNEGEILVTTTIGQHEKGIEYQSRYHGADADNRSPGCSIHPAAYIREQQEPDHADSSKSNAEYEEDED